MHIQGVGEGEKRENVQSDFFFSFFALELVHINPSCADERKICLGAAQEAFVDYRVFPSSVLDLHNLTAHRSVSSQLSSGSALICRDINMSFSPGSSGGCLWLLPGLLPTHHILLAAASATRGTNVFSVIT